MTAPILSRPVQVGGIHGSTEVAVVATADERVALAAEYDLLDVKALSSTATVTPGPDGAVEVTGQVTADIVQACVVTLVPVEQHIDERFSVRFVRPGSPELVPERPNAELVVDAEAPDPPDLLSGTSLDVGAIVEEAFVLGIDPYPRAPGAVLPQAGDDPDPAAESPFAVLARLKGKR